MNKNYIYLSIIIVILITFGIRECQYKNKTDTLISDISNYKGNVKIEKLKNQNLIYTNVALKVNSEKQLRELAANLNENIKQMLKNFKKVNNITYVTNEFNAGRDTLKNIINIPCDFKPFKVRHGSDSTYKLVMTIAKDYNSIDSLSIKDSLSLIFGRRKQGFMKYDYAVDINHSNRLMETTQIKTYQYIPEKKWYEKTWVHILTGLMIGGGINQGIKYYK